jgi:hypothetical protein
MLAALATPTIKQIPTNTIPTFNTGAALLIVSLLLAAFHPFSFLESLVVYPARKVSAGTATNNPTAANQTKEEWIFPHFDGIKSARKMPNFGGPPSISL